MDHDSFLLMEFSFTVCGTNKITGLHWQRHFRRSNEVKEISSYQTCIGRFSILYKSWVLYNYSTILLTIGVIHIRVETYKGRVSAEGSPTSHCSFYKYVWCPVHILKCLAKLIHFFNTGSVRFIKTSSVLKFLNWCISPVHSSKTFWKLCNSPSHYFIILFSQNWNKIKLSNIFCQHYQIHFVDISAHFYPNSIVFFRNLKKFKCDVTLSVYRFG